MKNTMWIATLLFAVAAGVCLLVLRAPTGLSSRALTGGEPVSVAQERVPGPLLAEPGLGESRIQVRTDESEFEPLENSTIPEVAAEDRSQWTVRQWRAHNIARQLAKLSAAEKVKANGPAGLLLNYSIATILEGQGRGPLQEGDQYYRRLVPPGDPRTGGIIVISVHGENYAFHEDEFPEYVAWYQSSDMGFRPRQPGDPIEDPFSPEVVEVVKQRALEALKLLEEF